MLFDLDDTLADRPAAIAAYAHVFAADHAQALRPCPVDDIHRALIAADDAGSLRQAERLSTAPLWRTPASPQALFDHWAAEFGKAARPVADLRPVLDALTRRGVAMGVVTNGGVAMQRAKIEALGIAPAMATVVISQEVGLRKPDAAIFRHALDAISCAPDDAWFVGDNPDVDVAGALGAGLRAFWIETPAFAPPPPPAERLAALGDLLAFL